MRKFILKIRIAFYATYSILLDKEHVYSGSRFNSCVVTRNNIKQRLNDIIDIANDEIIQSNVLYEANEILSQK